MNIPLLNPTSGIAPHLRQNDASEVAVGTAATVAPVVTNPAAVQAVDPKEQARQVEDAVQKINETVKSLNQSVGLEFSTDEDTKIRLVKLVDTNSKEVLRQIPTEEVVTIAKALDKLQGLLVRDKA
jgi:flagellar protein FlaG